MVALAESRAASWKGVLRHAGTVQAKIEKSFADDEPDYGRCGSQFWVELAEEFNRALHLHCSSPISVKALHQTQIPNKITISWSEFREKHQEDFSFH